MKHIGIAGITIPGSLLCIDTIVQHSYDHFGRELLKHPQITYTNPPLSETNPAIQGKNWPHVAGGLLDSVSRLERAGVDFVIIPSNAPHYAIKEVQAKAKIPVWSIVDISADEAKRRGFKKTGILGVGVTMSDGLYESPLRERGIEPVTLVPAAQRELNDLIFSEIIQNQPTVDTTEKMLACIRTLQDMGCDSFIAGCTEIPVVVTEETSPLPFIDTTRLLAVKAFEAAIS